MNPTTFLDHFSIELEKVLLPSWISIIAGFLVLPFYNWLAPLFGITQAGLQNIVFHF